MMIRIHQVVVLLVAGVTLSFAGCGSESSEQPTQTARDTEAAHDHDHPSEGPHGGSLIELGDEAYHAELVHDDATGSVTIYVLDSAAKNNIAIEATDVTINLKHGDRGEQFKLAASPIEGDPESQSSRFVSSDSELAVDLDREDAGAQLVLTINGKQYRGSIEHHHEHDE